MLGNHLIFKCGIPSYVTDYVSVLNWVVKLLQDIVALKFEAAQKDCVYLF